MANAAPTQTYEVLTGLNHPGPKGREVRKEPGDALDPREVTKKQLEWLLANGHVRASEGES